jgi:hypothetical protein
LKPLGLERAEFLCEDGDVDREGNGDEQDDAAEQGVEQRLDGPRLVHEAFYLQLPDGSDGEQHCENEYRENEGESPPAHGQQQPLEWRVLRKSAGTSCGR